MHALLDVPIKRKLTIISLLTSGLALLLAWLAFAMYEQIVFRQTMVTALSTTAAMVADNSSAALTFNDPTSAEQTLRSFKAHPHVIGAVIYDEAGHVFADYHRDAAQAAFKPPLIKPPGHRFENDSLRLFHPIDLAGERAGTVYIQPDPEEMRSRLRRYAVIGVLVMVAAFFAAVLLSAKLHATISRPISHLAGVVGQVAAEKNYSVRAVKQGEDELGRLIDGFNGMLGQVQERDAALEAAGAVPRAGMPFSAGRFLPGGWQDEGMAGLGVFERRDLAAVRIVNDSAQSEWAGAPQLQRRPGDAADLTDQHLSPVLFAAEDCGFRQQSSSDCSPRRSRLVELVEANVERFAADVHYVPHGTRRVLTPSELPPALERIAVHVEIAYPHGYREGNAVRMFFYDEDGRFLTWGTWAIDAEKRWILCEF